jgi:hypothetical protein
MRLLKSSGPFAALAYLLLSTFFTPSVTYAGSVYVALVIDPPTTAFSGITASGGFGGTSTLSGSGTWHLYAVDDVGNDFGISGILVTLLPGPGGAIPIKHNRLPFTLWDDDPSFGNGSGPFSTGMNAARGIMGNSIGGVQNASGNITIPRISGMGRSAGDFSLVAGGQSFADTINGQWGNYADFPAVDFGGGLRRALFIAEGTYTGLRPTIDTGIHSSLAYTWDDNTLFENTKRNVVLFPVPEPSLPLIAIAISALACRRIRR